MSKKAQILTEVKKAQKQFFEMRLHAQQRQQRATLSELSKGLTHLSNALGLSYSEIDDNYRNSKDQFLIGLQCGWASRDFKKAAMFAKAGRHSPVLIHLSDGLVRVAEEIENWHKN